MSVKAQSLTVSPDSPSGGANSFNRLFRPPGRANLPPAEDGIHDVSSPGTSQLQAPLEAFGPLHKSSSGNRVDWTAALESKRVQLRWDVKDPKAKPDSLDLNIVREVKGSTPDVVFSHARHGEMLDCANCHPAPYEAKKGANPMSMAMLALGQGCGMCHGSVAFPNAECRKCHSRPKGAAPAAAKTATPAAVKPAASVAAKPEAKK